MAALTANRQRLNVKAVQHSIKDQLTGVDSDEFYEGQLVCHNGSNKIAPAADTSGFFIAGVCTKRVTTGASNTEPIPFEYGQIEEFAIHSTTLTAADIGKNCFVYDDNLVSNAATMTNDVRVGKIVSFRTGYVGVQVGVFSQTDA